MYGSFAPPPPLRVTVVTSALVIQGTLHTRFRRITDVLNKPGAEHLMLTDVTFMEVGSRRVIAGPAVAQVQIDDILFVHTTGSTESGSSEHRTSKQPIKSVLLLPPFTVEGQIHLGYEPDIAQALDGLNGRFIPVTGARYYAYGVAESPNHVDLLVVNRVLAHIAVEVGVQWRTEAPLEHGGGSASSCSPAPTGSCYRSAGRSSRSPHSAQPPS